MKKARKKYFNDYFKENQNNVKKLWKGIRNLINVSNKSATNINKLIENGREILHNKEIADTMNNFYVNIGKSIDKKIPKGDKPFSHYLHNRNLYDIILNPCTNDEVRKYIGNLSESKASGPNNIPTSILKNYTDQLITPLVTLLNKSLAEGIFPDLLKVASICPIYKKMNGPIVPIIDQSRFSQI